MTLAEFFMALNAASIRLASVNGQLQLRAASGVITPDLVTAAADHKSTLLAMLPPAEQEDARDEREAVSREANDELPSDA